MTKVGTNNYEVLLPLAVPEPVRDFVRDRLAVAVDAGRAQSYGNPWVVKRSKVGVDVTMTGIKATSEDEAVRKAGYWMARVAKAMRLSFTGAGVENAKVKCLRS